LVIIFNGNDVLDEIVDNKVLVNVDATKTTEVIGDAGNFVEDAKKNLNIVIIHSVHQRTTRKMTNTQQACLSTLMQLKLCKMQAPS
jgi:hypothetical protein